MIFRICFFTHLQFENNISSRGGFRRGRGGRAPTLKFAKHGLSGVDLGGFRWKHFLANFTTKDIYIAPILEEYFKKLTSKSLSPLSARRNFFFYRYLYLKHISTCLLWYECSIQVVLRVKVGHKIIFKWSFFKHVASLRGNAC